MNKCIVFLVFLSGRKRSKVKGFTILVFFLLAFQYLLCVKTVHAHPTSFEDGFAVMSEMSQKNQEISLVYSPKYWLGTGIVLIRTPEEHNFVTAQVGWLIKRWNLPEAQGNSYLLGGIGYGTLKQSTEQEISGGMYRFGIQLDYETRKIYTFMRYIEHRFLENNKSVNDQFSAALGFASYLGEFDELNSWVIFKFVASDRFNDKTYILMLRFFYRNFLWEIGQDFDGNSQLNFMVRF